MDRRSWLWRRKSSQKTPGESESSGSISSPSERFSDEQASSSHSKQSPEVNSKAATNDESAEKVKILTEKLSAALLSISAKEELVKQHTRVTDEAVTGWEKAEREVSGLKLQLDAALKKNSALEDRVGHLDGALKECVRQLRHAREEQERKLEEVIAKREHEWESRKSELESQLTKLGSQLEAAKSEAVASIDAFRPKMDATEKENKSMRLELVALTRKLEVRTVERDFSTKTAESASKQRLECIKKVGKLEGECRRLRSLARKASADVDSVSDTRSEYTASQSGLQGNILMDDFLEMERLASMPLKGNTTNSPEVRAPSTDLEDKIKKLEAEKGGLQIALSDSQAQLEASKQQLKASEEQLKATNTELIRFQSQLVECHDQLRMLQDKLNAAENELIELQTQLIEREDQLKSSQGQLKEAESELVNLRTQLTRSQQQVKDTEARLSESQGKLIASEGQIKDANKMLVDLQAQLALTCELKREIERDLEASNAKRQGAELRVISLESEASSLLANFNSLVDEAHKERALSAEAMAKCGRLEDELSKRDLQPYIDHPVSFKDEKKAVQEKELAMAAGKLADCQKTIASLGRQLKSLATLDDFLADSDSPLEFSKEPSSVFKTSELGIVPCIDCQ